MHDSQVSTVLVPSESLLDDMEQLRAPLEEFDLAAEDSGVNSDLGAAVPSPHEQSDDDTESMEWSLQGDSEDTVSLPEVVVDVLPPLLPQLRAAFASMDQVDVVAIFRQRAAVMKSVPRFLHGPFRNALKVAMEEASSSDPTRQERGWKVFLLLPRILMHRPPGGGHISRDKLIARFEIFRRGEWRSLLEASAQCDARAAQARCRRRRRQVDNVEQRAIRAETLIHLGELSHARQVLEGAELAPGKLDALQDEERRPPIAT